METEWKNRWNDRYSSKTFAYGEEPNRYFKEKLDMLKPGNLLLPAEGEGRNAVYAAGKGWKVFAFDISEEGRKKAIMLANKKKVKITYQVGRVEELSYPELYFDVMALIYAHFPAPLKSKYHRALSKFLKPGGTVILEAFSKNHLACLARNAKVGGPKEIEMLFSKEEILADFGEYDFSELVETEIELNEGDFHNGTGSVIRFTATKH